MKTIIELLESSSQRFGNNIYILEKKSVKYEGTSYRDTRDQAFKVAAGLLASGVNKGDRIALLSESRTDWIISELGVLLAAAVSVPLSILLQGTDLKFRLNHSEAKWIIVSGQHAGKIDAIKNDLKTVEKIILLDPKPDYSAGEMYFGTLKQIGDRFMADHFDEVMERARAVGPDDPASISYTSGTTADPKGIILTHRNYTANIEQTLSLIDVPEWWTTLLILPWDHSFAHTVGIYIMMATGASIAAVQSGKSYMDSLKNIPENIREIRPVFMLSAPTLAKNFRKNIERSIKQKGPLIERLFNHALKVACYYNDLGWNKGKGMRILLKPYIGIFDLILFKKIRSGFGGRLKFFFGGAALLDIELQKFFYAIGIPMFQGYGLSEASPVISGNMENRHKLGSSGCLVKNLELKICDEDGNALPVGQAGEIVIRGENVMKGYWNNDKATREALRDGWLYTGDMGYLDEDGFLFVKGRFKSLLISDDGEKYSPEGIEETITGRSPYIDQLMLFNNQNKYTTALLTPNREALLRRARSETLDLSEAGTLETLLKLIESEINRYKPGGTDETLFLSRWLPSAVAVLNEPFSLDNGLVNATGKIVRSKIIEHYRNKIDYLYTPEARNIVNPVNLEAIREILKEK